MQMKKLESMLEEIEFARKRMIELAYDNPLNSEIVIKASTKLDKLLNVYYRLNQK